MEAGPENRGSAIEGSRATKAPVTKPVTAALLDVATKAFTCNLTPALTRADGGRQAAGGVVVERLVRPHVKLPS
jgi:hypothetical protein